MQLVTLRSCPTAGIAIVGVSLIAVTPLAAPLPRVHMPEIQLTAGEADAATDVVIDIVRHGQRISDNVLPASSTFGPPLSPLGEEQAQAVGEKLFSELGPVSGIWEGQGIRVMQTAEPFATLEHMTPIVTPGLNEVGGGIYGNDPIASIGGILYELNLGLWPLGFDLWPTVPGTTLVNGVATDLNFTQGIDTMYEGALANPVISDNGAITAVGFNSAVALTDWVLLNVKNPDLTLLTQLTIEGLKNGNLNGILPDTGIIEIEGNPTDGWTLVSWNGHSVPQTPDLFDQLFVDYRDLVLPPQIALWKGFLDFLGGGPVDQSIGYTGAAQSLVDTLVQNLATTAGDAVTSLSSLVASF